MHFIEHIISEPTKLVMTWQSSDEQQRTRYIIAELNATNENINLHYLTDSSDFNQARELGFEPYPAFPDVTKRYSKGVLDALMRRLPPKTRADYAQYLEGFRIRPGTQLSDFALLGYTGARLPSDGFAIINPFANVQGPFEFLVEAAGYRYIPNIKVQTGDPAHFHKEFDPLRNENVIKILVEDQHIGYITRALISSFDKWLSSGRIIDAWVEKKNGNPDQPMIYLYVRIAANMENI